MSGLCGWLGEGQASWQPTLSAMLAPLVRFDGSRPDTSGGDGFAVGAAGTSNTSTVLERQGVRVALVGHALWEGGGTSQSPSSVAGRLIDSYLAEGERALAHLRGDFAVAVIQPQAKRCLLAVDRIGIRNLVYEFAGQTLVFGSTCDAVQAHPAAQSVVDPQAIFNYVYFHMVPGPGTIFRGQTRVLPGHCVVFDGTTARAAPYWEMAFEDQPLSRPFEELKREFLGNLTEGVRELSLPDACAAFLSGGTDSSTISGLIGKVQAKTAQTYSIGFAAEGYDEMNYARLASRHFGTEHHEYYVTPDDVVDAIPRVAAIYDQPFGNASAVPTYHCARVARQDGVLRMLAGDGGDELYGGNARYAKQYQFSHYDRIPAFLRHGVVEPLSHLLPTEGPALLRKARSYIAQASLGLPARYEAYNLLERIGAENIFTPEFLATIDRRQPSALVAQTYHGARSGHWLNRLLTVDLKFTLADSDLPKVTRMCELAGVDVAFPMLHQEVVDFSAHLAPDLKLKGTTLRYFFKEALRGFLPDEILVKEKHGFGLPVGPWLLSHPNLKALAREALSSLRSRGIVRTDFLDALFNRYLAEHPGYYGTMVWVLMMLELWFQRGTGASSRVA